MEVLLAKTAGFCFGVKRAVDTVYNSLESGKRIYTYGPIIHNETVVEELERRGVEVIPEGSGGPEDKNGIVVIRSHGVSRQVYKQIESWGIRIADATCPFVKKIHDIVRKESEAGKKVMIAGNDGHPEVEGIKGWCVDTGQGGALVLSSPGEAEALTEDYRDVCVVAQTTFNSNKFQVILEILKQKYYNIKAVNTICSATRDRQREAEQLARTVAGRSGAMIVIGGRQSSNSRKLYEICSKECENTHFIQTLEDLNLELPKSIPCVGITAGASTPDKIIEEVQKYVRTNF